MRVQTIIQRTIVYNKFLSNFFKENYNDYICVRTETKKGKY